MTCMLGKNLLYSLKPPSILRAKKSLCTHIPSMLSHLALTPTLVFLSRILKCRLCLLHSHQLSNLLTTKYSSLALIHFILKSMKLFLHKNQPNLSHLQLLKHLKVKCNIPSTHCILSQLNLKPRKSLHLEARYSTLYPHSLSTLSHQSSPPLKHLMCLSTQILRFTLNLGPKDLLKNQCHLHSIALIKSQVAKCRNLFIHCILRHLNLKPLKILHLENFL